MKRFAKHFLAILLIVSLILPLCPAKAASENGRLITVTAQDIFSDRSLLLEVLVKDGLCYITPEEAAKLTGAEYHPETGVPSFQYNYTWDRKSLDARQIPHTKYAGVQYYRLEKICELLETWVGIPKEGILYFNSVPYNLGMLFAQVSGMLAHERSVCRRQYVRYHHQPAFQLFLGRQPAGRF